jgi:hypothetical protein
MLAGKGDRGRMLSREFSETLTAAAWRLTEKLRTNEPPGDTHPTLRTIRA